MDRNLRRRSSPVPAGVVPPRESICAVFAIVAALGILFFSGTPFASSASAQIPTGRAVPADIPTARAVPAATPALARAVPAFNSTPPPTPTPVQVAESDKLVALFLGDSMSLCGFGHSFDKRFREDPRFKATYTYVACGTIPGSWLKRRPFLNAKTACGYLTIKSTDGDSKPEIYEDSYGMTKGHKPDSHPVPKLEDLLEEHRPDILIIQTGDNLFDIFRDKKTIAVERHAAELKAQIVPFVEALKAPSTLRRVYWVSPPISGRVSGEIQDFVFDNVKTLASPKAVVIDSRPFVEYPYKRMEPDKEHFLGSQMDEWAGKVYDAVKADMAAHPLPPQGALVEETAPTPTPAGPDRAAEKEIDVTATLVSTSKPMSIAALMPYQESLVGYLYDVHEVTRGAYKEEQILVMHPAHIALKPQALDKYKIGSTYPLRLRELAGTQWETIKTSDDTGRIDLTPYIQVEDDARFPAHK